MADYRTPGVYIEEISTDPASIEGVATSIPAFIGYTTRAENSIGDSLVGVPAKISSLGEYMASFGTAPLQAFNVRADKNVTSDNEFVSVSVQFDGSEPETPSDFMFYSMQLFFENGGTPCYVFSLGADNMVSLDDFLSAIAALESLDDITLLVFPDACRLVDDAQHAAVCDAALNSCTKVQNRFAIVDVRDALPGGNDTNKKITENFRSNLRSTSVDVLKYGAAYYPYVKTASNFITEDDSITLSGFNLHTMQPDGTQASQIVHAASGLKISNSKIRQAEPEIYDAIKSLIRRAYVTVPPSAAVAGVYAQTDQARGVWKAPANVELKGVTAPAIAISDEENGGLNVDPTTAKSVNAIRMFPGKGTLVWGARTLAGNDNEYRYVSVCRLINFVEGSIQKSLPQFVFEPNAQRTWVKVHSMIENFLLELWRQNAFVGVNPEEAFYVTIGINTTMTEQDILEGRMIVEVGVALVRPAKFEILRIFQKMGES